MEAPRETEKEPGDHPATNRAPALVHPEVGIVNFPE
jgi:hypothetical protein